MYDAVQNVIDKVRNLRYNTFDYLASDYETVGVNISSTEGVRRLACYMSGMNSITIIIMNLFRQKDKN